MWEGEAVIKKAGAIAHARFMTRSVACEFRQPMTDQPRIAEHPSK